MYLGIDVGSVSIKYSIVDEKLNVREQGYFRTKGDVINSLKKLLSGIKTKFVKGICITGSARKLVQALISADLTTDEITAHRTAVKHLYPKVQTIIEIGGQDSKLIFFSKRNVDFEMNNVCAAGTGSFLDQQASRLGMDVVDFYKKGLKTKISHKIASKCTVFAESDMIHAQQSGIPLDQVIRGVHEGMVANYFAQLCNGKKLLPRFLFEGGTSENDLLVELFAEKLMKEKLIKKPSELIIPKPYNKTLGGIGAAILCKTKKIDNKRNVPIINKFEFLNNIECEQCSIKCGAKITRIKINDKIITHGRPCNK